MAGIIINTAATVALIVAAQGGAINDRSDEMEAKAEQDRLAESKPVDQGGETVPPE